MKEFNNGDEVLVSGCDYEVHAGPDTKGNYCLLSVGGFFEVVNIREIKPKPATININGVDVPGPESVVASDVGPNYISVGFRTISDADSFFRAMIDGK